MTRLRLFVYGTLTDEAVLARVAGRSFPRRPATLPGFVRVVGAHGYPTLVARADGRVDGFLLDDVDADALRALDAYEEEGRLYARRQVEVAVAGARVACEVYVGL